jgi:hypothetical protein
VDRDDELLRRSARRPEAFGEFYERPERRLLVGMVDGRMKVWMLQH